MYPPYKAPLNRPNARRVWWPVDPASSVLAKILAGSESSAEEIEAFHAYQWEGLRLLFAHYQIPQDGDPNFRFALLALRLAEHHVPYFQSRKPKARRWTSETQARLLRDIWAAQAKAKAQPLRAKGRATIKGACAALAYRGAYSRDSADSLGARYKGALRAPYFKALRQHLGEEKFRLYAALAGERAD